ncbi:DegV family protein [Cellulosimicrobium arenosum]|uniref:DegV family protein n=1 Tax=Cellulosimicrobium arenosum TaxID=2708133 RepID=UPI003BAA06A2
MDPTSSRHVHVVTDSTASLPAAPTAGLDVVPLHVVVEDETFREGVDIGPDEVAAYLSDGRRVSTSQPSPGAFAAAYDRAARDGALEIVSVHLSGDLSGTVHAAALAASRAPVPVRVVDSRTVAMGLGFAAIEAAVAAAAGADAEEVARRALDVADSSRSIFCVDSLEHLRRGGRISAAAATFGTVLGVRPLLAVRDGRIEVVQKVRTRAAAVERMTTVAVESAGRRQAPALAVHHAGDPDGATRFATELTRRCGLDVVVSPVSAVLGAHVGPGALAVVVADLAAGERADTCA